MLATSLFCHINELALTLGQKNEQDNVEELDQLLGLCGQGKNDAEAVKWAERLNCCHLTLSHIYIYRSLSPSLDAHIYLFQCLASRVDVTGQSFLDPWQQKLLQRELKRATTEPNFVSIFCQASYSQRHTYIVVRITMLYLGSLPRFPICGIFTGRP